jgi:starvation-inducible outer membrane lipoprotein
MKNMKKIIVAAGLGIILSSCSITLPYAVTNNTVGVKKGTSKTTLIFGQTGAYGGNIQSGLYSTNKNFGVIEAAKKGGISQIGSVDVKSTDFILFKKVEVIVTGE